MAPLIVGTRRFANEPIDDGFQVLVASDLDPITVEENFWEDFTAEHKNSWGPRMQEELGLCNCAKSYQTLPDFYQQTPKTRMMQARTKTKARKRRL